MSIDIAPHVPSEAEREQASALGLVVDDQAAMHMLTVACVRCEQRDFDAAMKILRSLVLLRPGFARVYETFGMVHHARGELARAHVCFEHALSCGSALYARVQLGEHATRTKNRRRAKALLLPVVEKDPDGAFGARASKLLSRL